MITLHSLIENGQEIPQELGGGVRHFSECLNKLLGKNQNQIHWRQERDAFIALCTKMVVGDQKNIPGLEQSYEDLSRLTAEAISSNNFPETIESKTPKPKGRDRKKKDKKESDPVDDEKKVEDPMEESPVVQEQQEEPVVEENQPNEADVEEVIQMKEDNDK